MNRILYIAASAIFLVGINFGTAAAQTGNSEIFVYSVESHESGFKFSSGANISKMPGYDNQPSFGPGGRSVLFTSDRDGGITNIHEHHFESGITHRIIDSSDSEYTPRSKDEDTISFVREGKGQGMTVWLFDRKSKAESKAIGVKEPVAYYDWNSKGGSLVWVRYASTARFIDIPGKRNIFVTDHVQPSSPQNIPGTDRFSFVHRQGDDSLWIKEFDPETRATRPLVQIKNNSIDYCWFPDGTIVTGDGSKLFGFNEKRDKKWVELADLSKDGLKDITRLASSPDGKRIAIVSNQ